MPGRGFLQRYRLPTVKPPRVKQINVSHFMAARAPLINTKERQSQGGAHLEGLPSIMAQGTICNTTYTQGHL